MPPPPAMSQEEAWNESAAAEIEEVIALQQECAQLIASQSSATAQLQELKESCSAELAELEVDAWKLQLFAELEKLRGQVEQLAPITVASKGGAPVPAAATAAAVESRPQSCPFPLEQSLQLAEVDGGGQTAAACTLLAEQELDDEIAALNKQLDQAKAEMQVMMELKSQLEMEVGLMPAVEGGACSGVDCACEA